MKSFHRVDFLGYKVICENGEYRLPNRIERFPNLTKMGEHIKNIEHNFKNIMNRIGLSQYNCDAGDDPNESSLKCQPPPKE